MPRIDIFSVRSQRGTPARSLGLMGLLLAAASLSVGVVAGRVTAPQPDASSKGWTAPIEVQGGVPVGHPRSRAGAVEATIAYAQALAQAALEGEDRLRAAQRATFTEGALRRVAPRVVREARTLRASLELAAGSALDLVPAARHAPVGYRLLRYGGNSATVALWAVDISSAGPTDTARAVWMTEQLVLVWRDGRWRIADATAGSGPVPLAIQRQPSSPAVLHEQLQSTRVARHAR